MKTNFINKEVGTKIALPSGTVCNWVVAGKTKRKPAPQQKIEVFAAECGPVQSS